MRNIGYDVKGLILPSGDKPVPQTRDRDPCLDKIIAGELLPRGSEFRLTLTFSGHRRGTDEKSARSI